MSHAGRQEEKVVVDAPVLNYLPLPLVQLSPYYAEIVLSKVSINHMPLYLISSAVMCLTAVCLHIYHVPALFMEDQ